MRFGERIAADFFSAREGEKELFLLLLGAEAVNGIAVKRVLHRENHAGGGAAAGNLLDNDAVGDVIKTGTAFRFRKCDAGEAKFGGLLESVAREAARFIELFRERLHFGFGEFAYGLLEEFLFFAEFKVHVGKKASTILTS